MINLALKKIRLRTLSVMAVLLLAAQVLVSAQVLAAATAPCPMMADHGQHHQAPLVEELVASSLAHSQHSGHAPPLSEAEVPMPTMECCGEESCPMLACVSIAALPNVPFTRFAPALAGIVDSYHFSVVPLISSSPFRPPIRHH